MTTSHPSGSAPTADAASGSLSADLDPARRAGFDAQLRTLAQGSARWAATTLTERVTLLRDLHASVSRASDDWVRTAARIKGLDPSSPSVGEEWMSGPFATLRSLDLMAESVSAIAAGHSPLEGLSFGTGPGGRVVVPVLPHDRYESLLLHGFHAEVWMRPGVSRGQVRGEAGLGELTPTSAGGVGLVLGAGNITSIPPLDVLSELIAFNRVSILKLNPIMQGLAEVYEAALRPLIDADLLAVVGGGATEGSYLAHHPEIVHVHITGSSATHDAVVWGTGHDAAVRKREGTPLLNKPMTSELGGVGPVIVVPSEWTARDLRFQAEHVATMRLHNGGYNCVAAQIVVLSADWPQKDDFVRELEAALDRAPARPAWYPGSNDRVAAAASHHPDAHRSADGGRLLVDVPAGAAGSYLRTTETFSPVLGVIEIAGTGQAFLDAAVTTANRQLLGTLGANLLIDPAERKRLGLGFDEAIAALRYGTIAINSWTGFGFLSAGATWGAFPGHTLEDVQSGIGSVHNGLLLDHTERTVVTGPFRPFPRSVVHGEFALFPKPPWFVSARTAARTGRLLTRFAQKPSWARMPGIFASAFRA